MYWRISGTAEHGEHEPPLPPPSLESTASALHLDVVILAVAVLLSILYLHGVVQLHRRGVGWPAARTASFLLGSLALLLVTNTGIGAYASVLMSLHMVQHMVVNMLVPLLWACGAPITLMLRRASVVDRRQLLRVLRSRGARLLAHPVLVTAVFVGSLFALYFTPLFELLMQSRAGHTLMLAHFLVSGFAFFWLLVGIDPDPHRPTPLARIPLIAIAMVTHTAFAVVLVFGSRVIGDAYFASLDLSWQPSRLDDQALAGGIAWTIGELLLVAVLVAIVLRWFGAAERAERARSRQRARERG